MKNFWTETAGEALAPVQLETDIETDIAIIGGGYTGLSSAYHLVKNYGINAHLLEAHEIGFGCSGRNGGFVSISIGKSDIGSWIKEYGLEQAQHIMNQGRDAVRLVRDILQTEKIDADATENGGLEIAHKPNRLVRLESYANLLLNQFGVPAKILSKTELEDGFLRSREAHGALLYGEGFALHAMKYLRGLARATYKQGAYLYSHSPVQKWEKDGKAHLLYTPKGRVKAKQVIIASNGYTKDSLHLHLSGRTLPVLSNIIVTRPLTESERQSVHWQTHLKVWDSRNLLFYYRLLPDNSLLFGARGGIYDTEGSRKERRAWLEKRMSEMFPPLSGIKSEYFWNGWVCATYDRYPHMGSTDNDSIHYALGYLGTGVALATFCGKLLAARIAGDDKFAPSPLLAKKLPIFPFPFLRRFYQMGIYTWFDIQDRFL